MYISPFPGNARGPCLAWENQTHSSHGWQLKMKSRLGEGVGQGFCITRVISRGHMRAQPHLDLTTKPLSGGTLGPCPTAVKQEAIKACEQGP